MIKVNQKEIEFKEGMTVGDALEIAGEFVDTMTLVMVKEKVLTLDQLNSEVLADGTHVKVLTIISGG